MLATKFIHPKRQRDNSREFFGLDYAIYRLRTENFVDPYRHTLTRVCIKWLAIISNVYLSVREKVLCILLGLFQNYNLTISISVIERPIHSSSSHNFPTWDKFSGFHWASGDSTCKSSSSGFSCIDARRWVQHNKWQWWVTVDVRVRWVWILWNSRPVQITVGC